MKMAKNGMKNTEAPFKEKNTAAKNAANITDHQGINKEAISAKTRVVKKLRIVLFI